MPVVPPKGKAALERPTGRTSAEVVADGGTLACDPAVVCEGGIFGTLVVWDLGGLGCVGFGVAGLDGLGPVGWLVSRWGLRPCPLVPCLA